MTLYIVAFRQGQQAFQSILAAIGGMYEDNLYMSNLFAYLGHPRRGAPAPPPELPRSPASARARASASRTSASATRAEDDWALRHVDLFIPRGQSLALVGQNGAGKTTLIKLLTRLYEPTEGRILLDGSDLRDWDAEALRRAHRRHLPGLQPVPAQGPRERRRRQRRAPRGRGAASSARSSAAARPRSSRRSPAGSRRRSAAGSRTGVELSGGQWQKVALARAFMREEADILVLDEPTAALDAEAEHAVFERFRQLAHGRTTLLISHRFPTVRMADRIVVLERGQIVEQGTHEELVAHGGRYAQLFTLQAKGYQ